MRFLIRKDVPLGASALLVILILGVLVSSGWSQEYSKVYAVTNTKIVIGNGKTIENGSILMRDGIIEAIGLNISIPADAVIIDGKELTVYPGFIDLHTNLGFVSSRPSGGARGMGGGRQAASTEPATNRRQFDANLRPDQIAVNLIDFNDENLKAAREAGITAAVTIKGTGVFPGKGSFINTFGKDPVSATIKSEAFQFIQYRNERRGYPSTLFAVVAFQRQNFLDAKYYMEREADFAKNARGALNSMKKRLSYDPALKALFPVITGEEQVVISVLKENDIKRAIELAHFENDFDLNYILSGVTEGYRVVDLLKREKKPLIVSLNYPAANRTTGYAFNLPIKPYEPPKAAGDTTSRGSSGRRGNRPGGRGGQRGGEQSSDDEEKSEIDKMVEEQLHGNAASLHKAGLNFVLSSGGNYKDFVKNIRLAVKAGLPADVALAKITREPAAMLGLEDIIGTVELGKIANLVVTDGDLFDEKTDIKMVFIDGNKIEPAKPAPATGSSEGVAGKWIVTVSSPEGEQESTMILEVDGNKLSGTYESMMGIADISEGTVTGNKISFTIDAGGMVITVNGTVSGNTMTGTIDIGDFASLEFTAKKPG